ncbi:hypothetical protein O9G_002857 [Rozella allomycis CSF55]|uniref:Uncharacterized protein n=1 Tax=Rozella allomycis (strain CSF55) TaxID=988480 RepID=A0A075AS13_ROZAC|nr:hypothetical protein O9G_002857 [Rozella allomycis CSF55]|eukprot:EPZ33056.1 hypothetical protein O9G_002857 [Rozella allomycis CSF55]
MKSAYTIHLTNFVEELMPYMKATVESFLRLLGDAIKKKELCIEADEKSHDDDLVMFIREEMEFFQLLWQFNFKKIQSAEGARWIRDKIIWPAISVCWHLDNHSSGDKSRDTSSKIPVSKHHDLCILNSFETDNTTSSLSDEKPEKVIVQIERNNQSPPEEEKNDELCKLKSEAVKRKQIEEMEKSEKPKKPKKLKRLI